MLVVLFSLNLLLVYCRVERDALSGVFFVSSACILFAVLFLGRRGTILVAFPVLRGSSETAVKGIVQSSIVICNEQKCCAA